MRRCNSEESAKHLFSAILKVLVKKTLRKSVIIALAVVLIIVIVGGYFVWTYYANLNQNKSTSNPAVEQVRDTIMAYIKANHNETAQYMKSFSWTGGNITPADLTGGQWYSYQSAGWNVTIQYPVALPPGSITTYSVTANYTSQVTPGEVLVSWQGTLQNGIVTQTSYKYNPYYP